MSITYGVTAAGFVAKPQETISSEVDADLRAILGNSAGTNADGTIPLQSMAGQLKTMLVNGYSAQWDLQQAVAASLDPNQASGAAQDVIGSLTGTVRDAQSFSTVTGTCTGDPLTVLVAGRVATVTGTGARFDTLTSATIAAVSAWAATTSYSVGNRVTNGNNVYQCTTGGTSAGSGGPTGTSSSISDNTVVWEWLGVGSGAVDVVFQAETAGPVGALAGTLQTIATPVSGWSSVTNLLDAATGSLQETDAALRARRNLELALDGNSTVDAIRAAILAVNQGSTDPNHQAPTTCTVFYNNTDAYDANGVPPHAVEIMVQGGTDQDIADAVWKSVAAGTATYGNQTSTVTDSQGNAQTVHWTRPVSVPIYVTAVVNYDASQWPANSDAAVAAAATSALLTYGQAVAVGVDARTSPLNGAILFGPSQVDSSGSPVVPAAPSSAPVVGLLEVSQLYIGTAPSPASGATISIGTRQIAQYESANVSITATSETP